MLKILSRSDIKHKDLSVREGTLIIVGDFGDGQGSSTALSNTDDWRFLPYQISTFSIFERESVDIETFTSDLMCHVSFMWGPDNKQRHC